MRARGRHAPSRALWWRAALGLALACGTPACEADAQASEAGGLDLLARRPDELAGAEPEAVDTERRALRLVPRASATWFASVSGDSGVRLSGRVEGDGLAEVHVGTLDPATGRADLSTRPVRLAAERGRVSADVPAPDPDGHLLAVRVTWIGDPGSRLTLETLRVRDPAARRRPPIVFVSADTLAARHMSLYGYDRPTTPNLEAFAKEAITFEHCIANAPWTVPSYMSQFSGLYPRASRFREPWESGSSEDWEDMQLASNRWTLAELLRGAGYRTAAFVGNTLLRDPLGFAQGFDRFDSEEAADSRQHGRTLAELWPLAEAWLDALRPGEIPFVFVNAMDVHGPYLPAEPFAGTFAGDRRAADGERVPVSMLPGTGAFGLVPRYVVEPLVREPLPDAYAPAGIVAAYDEEILGLDRDLADVLDSLRSRGLYDDAIVVISSDHGESTGGHDWYFMHNVLYEDVVHVPLLVRLPGGRHGGRRVSEPVQLVDLYPTLMELAAIPGSREHLHGRSLIPLVEGDGEAAPVVAEGGNLYGASITWNGWKLIESRPGRARLAPLLTHPGNVAWIYENYPALEGTQLGRNRLEDFTAPGYDLGEIIARLRAEREGPYYELYDLRADPDETNDLADVEPERVRELRDLLGRAARRSRAARETAVVVEAGADLSDEERDRLRALGYLGDD